jgi:hypothetical protein
MILIGKHFFDILSVRNKRSNLTESYTLSINWPPIDVHVLKFPFSEGKKKVESDIESGRGHLRRQGTKLC